MTELAKARLHDKIVDSLNHSRRPIGHIIEPFFMDENDPKFHTDKTDPRVVKSSPWYQLYLRSKSRKVLTQAKQKRILEVLTNRKDDKMSKNLKTKLTLKQQISVAGLVFLADIGAAFMLGLGASGILGGVAIAGMLGVFAADI